MIRSRKMRLRRILMTAVLLACSGAGAMAAPAPSGNPENPAIVAAPQWHAGSSWEYSDGYAIRVASTDSSATVFQRLDAPSQWFSMHGFLRQDAASPTAKRQTIYRTVPPSAGEALKASESLTFQREYLSNEKLMVHATSWTVEGRERITVPAGTFDCWIIVWRARSLKSNWTGFERWWYSPEAQHYVRLEYKYGAMATASRVLMRYHLAAPGEASLPPSSAAAAVSSAKASGAALQFVPRPFAQFPAVRPILVSAAILAAPAPLPLIEMDMAEPEAPKIANVSRASQASKSASVVAKSHKARKRRRKTSTQP
jgi:hypothetical protein